MHDEGPVHNLRRRLYARDEKPMQDVRAPLSQSDAQAPVAWEGERPPSAPRPLPIHKTGMGLATKFLIGSGLFFVVATIGAALFFFTGGNYISAQNIDLQIVAPPLVDGGATANLQYIITNRNPAELQLADLVIIYPEGTRNAKEPQKALNTERLSIGTIKPGQQVKLTSSAVFYGGEGSAQSVKATLEYSIAGSNAVFTKVGDTSITIGSSPISISVESPTEVIAGQAFTIKLTVQSNALEPVQDVLIQGQYPFGFSVQSATPRAGTGSTVWRLGTMAPGQTEIITIVGSIDGQDGDERVFRFLAGSTKDETAGRVEAPFLSVPVSLTVSKPFVSGRIAVEGKTGEKISVGGGKVLQGSITWRNNLSEAVSNLEVRLKLSGPVLDPGSVESGSGFYQSGDNTITWTSAQDPSLAYVPPGGQGTLQFTFATRAPGAGGVVYTNPIIDLELSLGGVRAGEDSVPGQITGAARTQVIVASAASLSAQALHFTGPYTNAGPMPPKVGVPTTYTVQWTVRNSSNTIGNAVVSTVLPPYVQFVAGGSGVTYDSGSRTVRWSIGDLKAGVGYSSSALSAAFQISINPSASQVGQAPLLTGAAALSGTDRFAQTPISASAEALSTKLTESGFAGGMDIVAPSQ